MSDLYRQNILDHYKNPKNFGDLDNADTYIHESNPLCGDEIDLYLVYDEDGTVVDVKFSGTGCAISMASTSMLTETLKGKTRDDLAKISYEDIVALLGADVAPARVKCAELPLVALKKAL